MDWHLCWKWPRFFKSICSGIPTMAYFVQKSDAYLSEYWKWVFVLLFISSFLTCCLIRQHTIIQRHQIHSCQCGWSRQVVWSFPWVSKSIYHCLIKWLIYPLGMLVDFFAVHQQRIYQINTLRLMLKLNNGLRRSADAVSCKCIVLPNLKKRQDVLMQHV